MLKLKDVSFTYVCQSGYIAEDRGPVSNVTGTSETAKSAQSGTADISENSESGTGGRILNSFNLNLKKGEFVLLTGASGCGKTTVLRLINGLIPRYYPGKVEGCIEINGEDISGRELYEISRSVGTVFQNPRSQFFNVDTTSEMAFACENQGLDPKEILKRISVTAGKFNIEKLLNRNLFKLSGGEKQKIACAATDVTGTEVILLDEPSANLDHDASLDLRRLMEKWKSEGKTIVVSEHRLAYLWGLPDRLVIMKNGIIDRVMEKNELDTVTPEILASMGLRTNVMENPVNMDLPDIAEADTSISLRNFSFRYHNGIFRKSKYSRNFGYDDVRIALNRITAVTGANGIGKTTFLNCLCGLEDNCRGVVEYDGIKLDSRERRKKFFMVMQDVNHQLFSESVWEELMLCFTGRNISDAEKDRTASEVLKKLDLYEYRDRHPMSLSGGQKQRVAIACALCSDRDFLLFDEPTSGLDQSHMLSVSALLKSLRDAGKTIVVVTHDSELIRCCCDRKIVLKRL